MKRWIQRTLIAVFGATALLGGVAAWAQHRHHSWQNMSEQDAAAMKARMVDKVAQRLKLDDAQKTRLNALADALRAQHQALRAGGADPRAEIQSLVAGNTFDRAKASMLIESKLAAVRTQSPAVVTAAADFYDSLRPEQQAQVREFMARRGQHRGHDRGDHERGQPRG